MTSTIKNYLYTSSYQILTLLLPLITTPYVTRVLGAAGLGEYSYAYSIARYFSLFIMLGMNNYGSRLIAISKDDKYLLSKNFSNAYTLQFLLGIIISIVYLLYALIYSENHLVTYALFFNVLSAVFDINWFLNGMELFKLTVTRNFIIKIIGLFCVFLFVKNVEDIIVYCLIMSLSLFISNIIVWPFLYNKIIFVRPTLEEIKKHIKPNLTLFVTVISISLYKIMDKIMLGIMTDYSQVGFYEVSEKFVSIPMIFVISLGTVMLPRASQLAKNVGENGKTTLNISILFAIVLSSSLSFGLMSVSNVFVPIFFGDGFDLCIYLFMILLPSNIFLAFANVIRTQHLLPFNKDKVYMKSTVLGAFINLVLNLIIINKFGAVGAAISTLISEMTVCIYQCYYSRKELPIIKYLIQILPIILSSIFMFIVVYNYQPDVTSLYYVIAIKVIIGIIVYVVSLIILAIIFFKKYDGLINLNINKKN